ncbi:MAG: DEAD/DEAH box helicase family protein [Epsilonproteobacteria bacterium]|nr:DEAD/DEAH box helicase family protein [Campylobacterota bacterium]
MSDTQHEFLIYTLSFAADKPTIDIYIATHANMQGEIAIVKKIPLFLLSTKKYSHLANLDRAILYLLKSNQYIQGQMGATIIEKLCHSGRFFTQDLQPITCQTHTPKLFFIQDGNALRIQFDIQYEHVLPTTPLFLYRQNALLEISSLSFDDFVLLDSKLNLHEAINIYHKFRKTLHITPPQGYKTTTIDTPPKAKLTLQANKYIQLSFMYDNYEIKPYPFEKVTIKDTFNGEVNIIRDNEYEHSVIKQISAYGFKDLENTFIAEDLIVWKRFLDDIDSLQQSYIVEFVDFDLSFEEVSGFSVDTVKQNDWFSLAFEINIGTQQYPLLPILVPILNNIESLDELSDTITLQYAPHKYVTLNTSEIRPMLETIFELLDKVNGDRLKIAKYDAHLLNFDEHIQWKDTDELKQLARKLKNYQGIQPINQPKGLMVELRDYQKFGVGWLMFLREFGFGGILADDMGLGKTIQTLSLLLLLKQQNKLNAPCLVVVPTSLLGNWKAEVEKFAPSLSYISIYGKDRHKHFKQISNYDIVFTTYTLVTRDYEKYTDEFEYIILDEAQKIKNPNTKSTQIIKKLKAKHKLALSGTPIENNLSELWSIFSFVMPGFLGSLQTFKKVFQTPIQKYHDYHKQQLLHKKISPFVLRRTKEKVLSQLPKKIEIIKYAEFSEEEIKLYESIRVMMNKQVRDAIAKNSLAKSQIIVLDALLKLRQICCHPQLLDISTAKKTKSSAKLELFLELIDELLSEGRKVLVFSQFTSMIDIIKREFDQRKIKYSVLTGKTTNRDEVIHQFKSHQTDVFLISLKAGGIGLNLTEADTVIHYDPWWNLAAQNQATDRSHRLGQDKNVFVYKLVVKNSIEEKILQLQQTKAKLVEIYDNSTIDTQSLLELLQD